MLHPPLPLPPHASLFTHHLNKTATPLSLSLSLSLSRPTYKQFFTDEKEKIFKIQNTHKKEEEEGEEEEEETEKSPLFIRETTSRETR